MSKNVQELLASVEDPNDLSDEDKLYLQDRNVMDFGLKVTDVNPDAPDPANTAQVPVGESVATVADDTVVDDVDDDSSANYEDMTNDALSEELEVRGLPKSGTKAELVARLVEDDQEPE